MYPDRPPSSAKGLRLISVGVGLPDRTLSNSHLSHLPNVDPSWTEAALGIRERRIVDLGEMTSDLAVKASKEALDRAGLASTSIDLIVLATTTPDRQIPATACIVQHKLGIPQIPAFDVSAACSGFLYAITIAAQFLQNSAVNRALIIGADTFSKITDWSSQDCVFFGDGAGAVIVERSDHPEAFFSSRLAASPDGLENFTVPQGSSFFQMNRAAVFSSAKNLVSELVKQVLADAGVSPESIGHVIPHQPSKKLLQAIAADIGVEFSKFTLTMDRFANTAAATVPIALNDAWLSGDIKDNSWVLFVAAGAGMTAGAAIYRWH